MSELDRRFILIDESEQALAVMAKRFAGRSDIDWIGCDPAALRESESARTE